jgi:hypothetical protein
MSKADRDQSARGGAGNGRDAASPSQAESPNVKPANATIQDDIPPVHVLEAAQNQDRKETEDLLAGFDRPGRSPKPVSKSKERDFVDYYARKKPGSADSGGGRAASPASGSGAAADAKPARQGDVSTVIVPRKREMPAWLGWAAAAFGMVLVGGAVAYLATSEGRSTAVEPTAPSAATTITSAASPPQANADTNIPPPAPVEATTTTTMEPSPSAPVTATAARSATKRDARALPSAAAATTAPTTAPRGTNATDDTKPPPRDDFIRDL